MAGLVDQLAVSTNMVDAQPAPVRHEIGCSLDAEQRPVRPGEQLE